MKVVWLDKNTHFFFLRPLTTMNFLMKQFVEWFVSPLAVPGLDRQCNVKQINQRMDFTNTNLHGNPIKQCWKLYMQYSCISYGDRNCLRRFSIMLSVFASESIVVNNGSWLAESLFIVNFMIVFCIWINQLDIVTLYIYTCILYWYRLTKDFH